MINFSSIPRASVWGKILRALLRLIPVNTQILIWQGRLRGKKWIKGSGVDSYWLGTYEFEKQKVFEKVIKKGDVVFDIGAQVGFYTLLASELTGENGRVFAFEPLPRNIFYFKKHILVNKCKNVMLIEAAVSDKQGETLFNVDAGSFSGHIGKEGNLRINMVTIDNLIASGEVLPPNVLKIDIEGEELAALEGAFTTLKQYHPIILLATHSPKIHNECLNFLKSLGYRCEPLTGDDVHKTDEILAYA